MFMLFTDHINNKTIEVKKVINIKIEIMTQPLQKGRDGIGE